MAAKASNCYTVLVIDDQPGIRRLLTEVLNDEGFAVLTAENGYEGVRLAQEMHPTVILMDMKMPGMDGIETLKELKALGQQQRVLMMTAYGELETVNQAKELGAPNYITKPFDIVELCTMIYKHIEQSQEEQCMLG